MDSRFHMPENTHINVRSVLNAGTKYLWLGTYTGLGVDGSQIFRSLTGGSYPVSFGPTAGIHHIHSVIEDPYNPGHIYAAMGDNGSPIGVERTKQHGAPGTWETIIPGTAPGGDWNPWQSVQISFSENWVWMAGDRIGIDVVVFDRDDLVPMSASTNHHYNIAVPNPAALGDRFYRIGYWGAVDPATESYCLVAMDTSDIGNTQGVFILPHVGGRFELVESRPSGGVGEVSGRCLSGTGCSGPGR